jgi:hypothetical protein
LKAGCANSTPPNRSHASSSVQNTLNVCAPRKASADQRDSERGDDEKPDPDIRDLRKVVARENSVFGRRGPRDHQKAEHDGDPVLGAPVVGRGGRSGTCRRSRMGQSLVGHGALVMIAARAGL